MAKKKGLEHILTTSAGTEIAIINGLSGSNVYLLSNCKKKYLIDSSFEGDSEFIYKELKFNNIEKIDEILLTHYHKDHSGGASILAKKLNSKISISIEDNLIFEGKKQYIFLPKDIEQKRQTFLNSSPMWKNCFSKSSDWYPKIDKILKTGDNIVDFEILIFPGHTEGTLVLYNPLDKILISSDYLIYPKGVFPTFFKSFIKSVNVDIRKAEESTKKLLRLDFNTLLPAHGNYVKTGAKTIIKNSELYGDF